MVAATKRTFYPLEHKVRVLDEVARELAGDEPDGAVVRVAHRHGHAAGLVYSWGQAEKDIRKAAKKEAAQAMRTERERPTMPSSRRLPLPPRVPETGMVLNGSVKTKGQELDPEGPEVAIRALGPWLRGVVKEELPGALDRVLDGKAEALIESIVEKKLDAVVRRAMGEAFGTTKGETDGS